MQLIQLNQGLEIEKMIPCNREENIVDTFWHLVDTSRFHQKDREYVKMVFSLTGLSLGSAVMDALKRPEQQEVYRKELEQRLEIIRHGCLTKQD